MGTFSTRNPPPSREAPSVGGYRRGTRARTTRAGTWFPAVGPAEEPAGLLLLHPAVELGPLRATLVALDGLALPGVLPTRSELVDQAGRTWLVATAAAVPTLADLPDDGPHRTLGTAAAVLADLGGTLLAAHRAGLAHGAFGAQAVVIGPDGAARLTDWGTSEHPDPAADVTGWAELADLLRDEWAEGPRGAVLEQAAELAADPAVDPDAGLAAALDLLHGPAAGARRDALAEATSRPPRPARRRPRRTPPPLPPEVADAPEPTWSPAPAALPARPESTAGGSGGGDEDDDARSGRGRPIGLVLAVVVLVAGALFAVARALSPDGVPSGPATAAPPTPHPLPYPPTQPLSAAPAEPPAGSLAGGGDLEIRSAQVTTQYTGSACVALAAFGTNGRPGRVIFRWYGLAGSLPVGTVSAPPGGRQVEVGLVWTPHDSPVPGSTVSLQLLDPRGVVTSGPVPTICQ